MRAHNEDAGGSSTHTHAHLLAHAHRHHTFAMRPKKITFSLCCESPSDQPPCGFDFHNFIHIDMHIVSKKRDRKKLTA